MYSRYCTVEAGLDTVAHSAKPQRRQMHDGTVLLL